MKAPKLTQTQLYEVLVAEIESFRTTKREYDKILSRISEHSKRLDELYHTPICVDIRAMREEHARIQSTLQKGLYIPQWLVVSFLFLILGLGISLFFNYKQYATTEQEHREYIEYVKPYIEELEKQVPKNKTKK